MTATALAPAEVVVTAPEGTATVPAWMKKESFSPRIATEIEMRKWDRLTELTVVRATSLSSILDRKPYLKHLSRLHDHTPRPAKIVFLVARYGLAAPRELAELFGFFARPSDLEFAQAGPQAALALVEAQAKIEALRNRQDPLASLREVIEATAKLRAPSGRLSAELVAAEFGLPLAEIARLAGVTRQAVSKTDDAPSLQPTLERLARVARLRTVLTAKDFLNWLNRPNVQLDGQTPLATILQGEGEAVAGLAESMLVGNPI